MPYKTIYFDTSFYVHLQRAAPTLAHVTLDQLQKMRVRRVESVELFLELDVSPNAEGKRLLVDRLAQWSIPPLRINEADLVWLALDERPAGIDMVREIQRREGRADAFSASAFQPISIGEVPVLEDSIERELGIRVAVNDRASVLQMMVNVFDRMSGIDLPYPLAVLLEDMRELCRRYAAGEVGEAEFAAIAAAMPERVQKISEDLSPGTTVENTIRSGVLTGNSRSRDIALGRASDKSEKRHASTISDLGHLSLFLRNIDSIDLLMMDGPQLAALDQRAAPQLQHVRDRIFTAPDLPGVVEAIRTRYS